MDFEALNNHLLNIENERQLILLLNKSKKYQLKSILHGGIVEELTVENGYARYTFKNSNTIGKCKINKLHQYLEF